MIYNNSYFNEQLKKTYIEGKKGELNLIFCVVIIALCSLVLHNVLSSLRETIVGTLLPHLTYYTIFSMISVYNMVIIIFFVSLCIVKYNRVTIAEISTNKWYLLIKTGHSPQKLIFAKITANILSVVFIYSLTFIALILLGSLMKMDMQINAIFSLALLGLIQVFFVVELIMGISIFVKDRGNCLLLTLLGIIAMYALALFTGFYGVSASVSRMEKSTYLFSGTTSIYIYVLLLVAFIMLFLGVVKGNVLATHYKPKAQLGENVYSVNYTDNRTKFYKYTAHSKPTVFSVFAKIALGMVVIVSILANLGIIMLASFNNPDKDMGDHIMLIFESQTMQDAIIKNDFVCFQKTPVNATYRIGDIVVYYNNRSPVVQIVEAINEDGTYTLDYLKYPNGTALDSKEEILYSSQISGKLITKSSWLGAFLIWNKTMVAKVFTTILPTLLLIFYDKLEGIFKFIKATAGTDEDDGEVEVRRI